MQKIGKEVKIGLAVIGVLLVAFGYVLVKRLAHPSDETAATADAAADSADAAKAGSRPGVQKPTVISATDSDRPVEVAAGESKRSRWTNGADQGASSADAKGAESAADPKNPFMQTPPESAGSADAHAGSLFGRNEGGSGGSSRSDDPRRNEAGFPHRDDSTTGGAVQTSDSAPLAPAATDQAAPADSHSIFGKSPAERLTEGEKGTAVDKPPAGEKPANINPFQRRSADAATAGDTLPRRAADAAPANPFNRSAADAGPDARNSTGQWGTDRQSPQSSSLTPVENPALRPTGTGDAAADSRNPLRRTADADAQLGVGAADAGSRFPGRSRFGQPDSGPANPVVPPREGGAFDSPNRLESGIAATPGSVRQSGIGPSATAQPLVADDAAAKPGQYIVQPNDNYWTISEKVYGTGGYFKAIYENNRRQHPKAERLQVGESLLVPDVAVLQRSYPDLCPKPGHTSAPQRTMTASARIRPNTKVYVVEEGDTLFEIARHQLGKPSRWSEIYQLNREVLGKDFDYLKPGTELLIPSGEARPDPIARQPGGTVSQ